MNVEGEGSGGALAGVTVVEVAGSVGAAYCTKLLGELGAHVTLVEDEDGHPLRRRGPSRPGSAHSGLFAYLALNKHSVVTSREAAADRRALGELLESADILVTDGQSPLDGAVRGATLPAHLIHVDLSPFGRSGPYASWKGSDIALWALGGHMYFIGEKAREPLLVPCSQAEFHGGVHAALAALAALREQRRSGFGQAVEVSALEALLSAHSWLSVAWSHAGTVLDRTTHDLVRCRDGWVCFMRGAAYPNIFVMIGRPEEADDERWSVRGEWAAKAKETYALVSAWCAEHTREEVVEAAQALRIACAPVNDPGDLAESIQLESRQWWLDVDDPALGALRIPGFPYRLTESPAEAARPAPLPGQHSAPPARPRPVKAPSGVAPAGTGGPLQGIRVVEVTANWAGPVCGRHLADLGADVIKVEAPKRPATRGAFWPNMDPQRQGYNRAGYFNQMNRNKRDVVLDLGGASGRSAFLELVRTADVVIENNSARVMPNLGLSYDVLRQVNPRLIMASICGCGASGPERDHLAYGVTIEASCGLAALTGYDDSQPYRTGSAVPTPPGVRTGSMPHMGNYADPVTGVHAAVAVLAALAYRERTGRGQWIDVAMTEATMGLFSEALIDYQLTGRVRGRIGNRDERFCPQGAYRCAGIDNWVALSVQSDEEWRGLCEVMGREDLANDAGLATLEGRKARADEIDTAITGWTAEREQYEAAWELQRAGISAAPVLANWQVLADPHLFERGFYRPIKHTVAGVYPYPSWPWQFSRTPASIRLAAPKFGEHNREILREAGLSDDHVDLLYAEGATADEPQ